jgi:hypothetical protein
MGTIEVPPWIKPHLHRQYLALTEPRWPLRSGHLTILTVPRFCQHYLPGHSSSQINLQPLQPQSLPQLQRLTVSQMI